MKSVPIVALLVTLAASTTLAESKKYPGKKPDKDLEAEQKSKVWEAALHPERLTYDELVDHARPAVSDSRATEARLTTAILELDKAVALQPKKPAAYELRGEAYQTLKNWAKCADDLGAAEARKPRDPDDPRIDARRALGVCQARAGRYNAAEQTLAQAAATGSKDGQLWMRLGEVRIALGKLDEAIGALTTAVEAPELAQGATIRWLLATAYDRARMPSQATEQLVIGYRADRNFTVLTNPQSPFLGTAEADYMLGLAWGAAEPPRPEVQLLYFQRFLKLATDSPWRKRAEEHIKELRAVEYPDSISRRYAAPLDLEVARLMIKKGMPAMRTCMAKTPGLILNVMITRTGPRTPTPAPTPYRGDPEIFSGRMRRPPISAPAAPGVTITQDGVYNFYDATRADIDAAIRCIEPIAEKLPLPPIKERDTAYAVVFSVVAP